MSKIALVVDTACDLNSELRAKFGIDDAVEGIVVRPDGSTFEADSDWKNTTPEEYFGSMAKGKTIYKSSTCTGETAERVLRDHLSKGEDVLVITIGRKFSAMADLFIGAWERIKDEFPGRRVEVTDSARYSGGFALVAIKAAKLIKEGKSLDEIVEEVNRYRYTTHQAGPLDDLYFLNKSGRVSKTIAFMGTLVGIRPLGDFQRDGLTSVLGKAKGENAALKAAIKYIKLTAVNPEEQTMIIANSYRQEEAEKYEKMIREEINPKEIIMVSIGQQTGANVGPGLCACFYEGNEVLEDMAAEKEAMEKALRK